MACKSFVTLRSVLRHGVSLCRWTCRPAAKARKRMSTTKSGCHYRRCQRQCSRCEERHQHRSSYRSSACRRCCAGLDPSEARPGGKGRGRGRSCEIGSKFGWKTPRKPQGFPTAVSRKPAKSSPTRANSRSRCACHLLGSYQIAANPTARLRSDAVITVERVTPSVASLKRSQRDIFMTIPPLCSRSPALDGAGTEKVQCRLAIRGNRAQS